MGSSTHIAWAIENGFFSKNYNASMVSMIFWDSLTFLDPIAAILLFLKPKSGIYLTLIIILVDIIHNNTIYFNELYLQSLPLGDWIIKYWMILGQLIFAVFVMITFRNNHSEITKSKL